MPITVKRNSGGRKTSPASEAVFARAACDRRLASQAGDSGTAASTIAPSTAGAAETSITQRQSPEVIGRKTANSDSNISPRLAVAPNRPAIDGRDMPGRASDASETPFGQAPPMPVQARNHKRRSCSGVCTKTQKARHQRIG